MMYKFIQILFYTKGSPDREREKAADMHRRHATKCLLLYRWVGKKSLRNLESHSLKNEILDYFTQTGNIPVKTTKI